MAEAVLSGARYQTFLMQVQEPRPIPLAFNGETETFEMLFKTHFKSLYAYAYTIVKDEMAAEEMVQNVFLRIWEKKGGVDIQTPALAYLYKSVYHESLNYLKHQKIKARYQVHVMQQTNNHNDQGASRKILVKELEEYILTLTLESVFS